MQRKVFVKAKNKKVHNQIALDFDSGNTNILPFNDKADNCEIIYDIPYADLPEDTMSLISSYFFEYLKEQSEKIGSENKNDSDDEIIERIIKIGEERIDSLIETLSIKNLLRNCVIDESYFSSLKIGLYNLRKLKY